MLALFLGVLLAVDGPDFFARSGIQADDLADGVIAAPRSVDQLHVELALMQDRSRSHTELNVDFAVAFFDVELPNDLAVTIQAGQVAGPKEHPDMLAIGRGGRRSGVPFTGPSVLVPCRDLGLPEFRPP